MDISVAVTENNAGRFYELATEKTTLTVWVGRHCVTTCVQNSSAKAWGGKGKTFHGATALQEAAKHYKSETCKAMIEHVASLEQARATQVAA
jgi:hypothetical protein